MRSSFPILLFIGACSNLTAVTSETANECGNGIDDDRDELTDCEDPDCARTSFCNSPPSAPVVSITPMTPSLEDGLLCMVTGESTDADDDEITYAFDWKINGTTTFQNVEEIDAAETKEGEEWLCEVTPYDGLTNGPTASVAVVIGPTCDQDGDGYLAATESCGGDDCNDVDASVHPFAGDTYGDSVDSDCDGLDCQAEYGDTTYFAACDNDKGEWHDAKNTCLLAKYDGLASIINEKENATIASLIETVYQQGGPKDSAAWLGGSDAVSEGNWEWTSGLPWVYTNWAPGEPNDYTTGEDFLAINRAGLGSERAGKWNDGKYQQIMVCEVR